MNHKKISIAVSALFFFVGIALQAQNLKIGYVDAQAVYNQLPEVKTAQSTLETYGKQLQKGIQDKQKTLQEKYEAYQKAAQGMTEAMRTATEKELQGLQEQIQIAQQDAQAQMQKKQDELLKPIEEKIQKAIGAVSTENSYTYVFSKEMLLHYPSTDDISSLVLKKLGVTPGTVTNTTKPNTVTPK